MEREPAGALRGGIASHSPNLAQHMGWQHAPLWSIGTIIAGQVGTSPPTRPVVPLGDTAAVLLGTIVCLLVIYAIVAAHLRKED